MGLRFVCMHGNACSEYGARVVRSGMARSSGKVGASVSEFSAGGDSEEFSCLTGFGPAEASEHQSE